MDRTRLLRWEHGRETRVSAETLGQLRTEPAAYQTRTCTRCGRNTTFVREDARGGWYSCIECGRYA